MHYIALDFIHLVLPVYESYEIYKWFNSSSNRKINPIHIRGVANSSSISKKVNVTIRRWISKLSERTRGLRTNRITDYDNLFWCKCRVIKSYNVPVWYICILQRGRSFGKSFFGPYFVETPLVFHVRRAEVSYSWSPMQHHNCSPQYSEYKCMPRLHPTGLGCIYYLSRLEDTSCPDGDCDDGKPHKPA